MQNTRALNINVNICVPTYTTVCPHVYVHAHIVSTQMHIEMHSFLPGNISSAAPEAKKRILEFSGGCR